MSDFDRIREEGERISREEGYKVLLAEIAARDKEIEALRLTDAERKAIKAAIARCEDITYGSEAEPEAAATLRGLLERFAIGSGERDA